MLASHPGWTGKAAGLMVNSAEAAVGIQGCASVTKLPVVQDDTGDLLRAAFGAQYDTVAIVGPDGRLAYLKAGAQFPKDAEEVAGVVDSLVLP
jgi:hypothetical protein